MRSIICILFSARVIHQKLVEVGKLAVSFVSGQNQNLKRFLCEAFFLQSMALYVQAIMLVNFLELHDVQEIS